MYSECVCIVCASCVRRCVYPAGSFVSHGGVCLRVSVAARATSVCWRVCVVCVCIKCGCVLEIYHLMSLGSDKIIIVIHDG